MFTWKIDNMAVFKHETVPCRIPKVSATIPLLNGNSKGADGGLEGKEGGNGSREGPEQMW